MTALARLCRRRNVRLKLTVGAARNECHWESVDSWGAPVQNWRCTLSYAGRQFTFDYFGGPNAPTPSVAGIVENLLSDAAIGDGDYEDYLEVFGLEDEPRNFKQFCMMERTADGIERLFGHSLPIFHRAMNAWYDDGNGVDLCADEENDEDQWADVYDDSTNLAW